MPQSHDTQPEPLSVALLSPGWPVEAMANGIVSYTAAMARGLKDLGIACRVLTPRSTDDVPDEFVHVLRTNNDSLFSKVMWRLSPEAWPHRSFCAALLRDVRRLHRQHGLQLLELEESYGWARLLAGRSPVSLVVRLHGPWFLNGAANGAAQDTRFHRRDCWEKAGVLAADAVTAPSRDVLERTRAHFGLTLPNAAVIPNPVQPVPLAKRWDLRNCDRNRMVFVGRFDRHKGGDTVIDAFAHILKHVPDIRLDFVGPDRGCVDDAGREWKFDDYVREKLGEAGRNKVKYHGFQAGSTAAELRKRALVTVAPSRYETFGIAAAEAMMAGCPLVVCGAGALTELVQDGCNGLIAEPGKAADLADKVLSLIRNPTRAAKLGEQAAADAEARYAPQVIARQTAEFYRQVLVESPRQRHAKRSTPGARPSASVSV